MAHSQLNLSALPPWLFVRSGNLFWLVMHQQQVYIMRLMRLPKPRRTGNTTKKSTKTSTVLYEKMTFQISSYTIVVRFLIAQKDNKNCLTCLFIDPKTHQPRSTGSPRPMPKRPRSSVVQTLATARSGKMVGSWWFFPQILWNGFTPLKVTVFPAKWCLEDDFPSKKWALSFGGPSWILRWCTFNLRCGRSTLLGPRWWLSHPSEKSARQNGLTFPN